jgi:hypothetical protein
MLEYPGIAGETRMDYLHQEFEVGPDDTIEVVLDNPANVQLLDPENFDAYRGRRPYRYFGGHVTTSPYSISPPRQGKWHLVVDLGGMPGRVAAGVRISTSVAQ